MTGARRLANHQAAHPPTWPDDPHHRLAARTLLTALQTALRTENSATLTLERWCATHRIADDPRIVASLLPATDRPATARQRTLLGIGPEAAVRHRHVRLRCGGHLLSEADNWYVPDRLTPAMNATLEAGSVPFGRAVASLGFSRTTLSSVLLWSPPADPSPAGLLFSGTLIENQAVLHDGGGRPFALLIERYRAGVLAFPPPLA